MTREFVAAKEGIQLWGPVVNLAAAGAANATAIWTVSAGAQQVGNKSHRLVHLKARANGMGGNQWLQVGTGVGGAYADLIPPLRLIDNMDNDFDLEEVESFATVTAFPTALPAGSVDVQIKVEERG